MKMAFLLMMLIRILPAGQPASGAKELQAKLPGARALPTAPHCDEVQATALTITCTYSGNSSTDGPGSDGEAPRIALNRAAISFAPWDESHMHIRLDFTNDGPGKITDKRMVYLTIDDDRGQNHMRRALLHVDFRRLAPGQPMIFDETLLAPAFAPGSYTISLWIPSTDRASEFDPKEDLLLKSSGVAQRLTGLNRIASFALKAGAGRKPIARPD